MTNRYLIGLYNRQNCFSLFLAMAAHTRIGVFLRHFVAVLVPCGCLAQETVTIGLVDSFPADFYVHTYAATVRLLAKSLAPIKVRSVDIDPHRRDDDIRDKKPDFLLASGSAYISLADTFGAQALVTRRQSRNAGGVASTIVVRSDRTDIQTMADLKKKSVATTDTESFDGWIIAQGEIASQGFSPDGFFSRIETTGTGIPDVVSLVQVRAVDAGILSSCEYERKLREGFIHEGELRIIGRKADDGGCVRSTARYPDAVMAAMPSATPQTTRALLIALLSQQPQKEGFDWALTNSNASTAVLMKTLHVGPYAAMRPMSAGDFVKRYSRELWLAAALLLAVVFHIVTLNILVRRRTRELSQAVQTNQRIHETARRAIGRLQTFERVSLVGQISSLFAHEIKQPLTGIVYYAGALELLLKNKGMADPMVSRLIGKINEQAELSGKIVEKVRSYARQENVRNVPVLLASAVSEALSTLRDPSAIVADVPATLSVLADPMELMLVAANLLKNAVQAAERASKPAIRIAACDLGDGFCALTVTDNGPRLDPATFEKLGKSVFTSKRNGVGLGLLICSAIAERHGGHLEIRQMEPNGLSVSLILPASPLTKEPRDEKP